MDNSTVDFLVNKASNILKLRVTWWNQFHFLELPICKLYILGVSTPASHWIKKKFLYFSIFLFEILVTVQAHKNQLLICVSHCIHMGKYQSINSEYIVIFAPCFFFRPFYTCKCLNSVLTLPRHSFWWIFFLINTAISVLFWYLPVLNLPADNESKRGQTKIGANISNLIKLQAIILSKYNVQGHNAIFLLTISRLWRGHRCPQWWCFLTGLYHSAAMHSSRYCPHELTTTTTNKKCI